MVKNNTGQFGAVGNAQMNGSNIELHSWKSNVRSPARHKEHKEAEGIPPLVFICCGDIYLIPPFARCVVIKHLVYVYTLQSSKI